MRHAMSMFWLRECGARLLPQGRRESKRLSDQSPSADDHIRHQSQSRDGWKRRWREKRVQVRWDCRCRRLVVASRAAGVVSRGHGTPSQNSPKPFFQFFPGTAAPDLFVGNGSSAILPLSRCRNVGGWARAVVLQKRQNARPPTPLGLLWWLSACADGPSETRSGRRQLSHRHCSALAEQSHPSALSSLAENADRRNVILPPRHGRRQRRYKRPRSSFAEAARSLAKNPALLLPSKNMPCMPLLQCASVNSIAASAQPHRLATPR